MRKEYSIFAGLALMFVMTSAQAEVKPDAAPVAGAVENAATAPGKCVSMWDLQDFKDGQLNNKIAGESALSAKEPFPQPVTEPLTGMRFTKNCISFGKCPAIMSSGAPYSMITEIVPEGIPGAYCGGIVQAFSYLNSGFRISLGQDMKLGVEINTGKGSENTKYVQSKTVLQIGTKYKVEVRFDGKMASLFINGQLDNAIACPLPAPCSGDIQIGCASGKDYYFIGIIGSVGFYAIDPAKDEKK